MELIVESRIKIYRDAAGYWSLEEIVCGEEKAKRHAIRRITVSHKNSLQTAFPPSLRLPHPRCRSTHPLRSILQFVTGKNNPREKRPGDVTKRRGIGAEGERERKREREKEAIAGFSRTVVVIGPATIARLQN